MERRKEKGSAGHDAPVAYIRLRRKADLRQERMLGATDTLAEGR